MELVKKSSQNMKLLPMWDDCFIDGSSESETPTSHMEARTQLLEPTPLFPGFCVKKEMQSGIDQGVICLSL